MRAIVNEYARGPSQTACDGLGEVPEEMVEAYEEQRNFIGGRRSQHADIVRMLQTTAPKKRRFICIDALDECVPEHRLKLLDLLNKILQESPCTQRFVTGRPHIRREIGRRLAGRVTSLLISTGRDDIIRYLHSRVAEDPTPDAMGSSPGAGVLGGVPEDLPEICVVPGRTRGSYDNHSLSETYLDSCYFRSISVPRRGNHDLLSAAKAQPNCRWFRAAGCLWRNAGSYKGTVGKSEAWNGRSDGDITRGGHWGQLTVPRPISRNQVAKYQYQQCLFNRDITSLL